LRAAPAEQLARRGKLHVNFEANDGGVGLGHRKDFAANRANGRESGNYLSGEVSSNEAFVLEVGVMTEV
jgi:hypothetical protein